MVALSADRGATLAPPVADRALPEAPAQASLLRLPAGAAGRPVIAFANAAGPGRTRMVVRLSHDDGRTWPEARVVHDGPAAYSGLVALADGGVGVLYERGVASPYEAIAFARLPGAAR